MTKENNLYSEKMEKKQIHSASMEQTFICAFTFSYFHICALKLTLEKHKKAYEMLNIKFCHYFDNKKCAFK